MMQVLSEDLSRVQNIQSVSNFQFIEQSKIRTENLCTNFKQALADFVSKQTITAGICAKTWESQFQSQVYKIYNQITAKFENVNINCMQEKNLNCIYIDLANITCMQIWCFIYLVIISSILL